jgi:hypothetical protein
LLVQQKDQQKINATPHHRLSVHLNVQRRMRPEIIQDDLSTKAAVFRSQNDDQAVKQELKVFRHRFLELFPR